MISLSCRTCKYVHTPPQPWRRLSPNGVYSCEFGHAFDKRASRCMSRSLCAWLCRQTTCMIAGAKGVSRCTPGAGATEILPHTDLFPSQAVHPCGTYVKVYMNYRGVEAGVSSLLLAHTLGASPTSLTSPVTGSHYKGGVGPGAGPLGQSPHPPTRSTPCAGSHSGAHAKLDRLLAFLGRPTSGHQDEDPHSTPTVCHECLMGGPCNGEKPSG